MMLLVDVLINRTVMEGPMSVKEQNLFNQCEYGHLKQKFA